MLIELLSIVSDLLSPHHAPHTHIRTHALTHTHTHTHTRQLEFNGVLFHEFFVVKPSPSLPPPPPSWSIIINGNTSGYDDDDDDRVVVARNPSAIRSLASRLDENEVCIREYVWTYIYGWVDAYDGVCTYGYTCSFRNPCNHLADVNGCKKHPRLAELNRGSPAVRYSHSRPGRMASQSRPTSSTHLPPDNTHPRALSRPSLLHPPAFFCA